MSFLIHKSIFNENIIDPMIEQIYNKPIDTFLITFNKNENKNEDVYEVLDIQEENEKYKLGFDDQDLKFYQEIVVKN